jgi:hypothetical protein
MSENVSPVAQQPPPTPEQAINTVSAAVKMLKLTYEEHVLLDRCLIVLGGVVKANEPVVGPVEVPAPKKKGS